MFLAAITVIALFSGGNVRPSGRRRLEASSPAPNEDEEVADIDDTFAFDVAARYNEGLVANVDAMDTSLTTILAGNVAVLVFTIDKIKELARVQEVGAIALLSASTLCCVIAYALGFPFRSSRREGIRPRSFLPDLVMRPKQALSGGVILLVNAGERNLAIHIVNKGLAVTAILFLLAGAVVVAMARAGGVVVN